MRVYAQQISYTTRIRFLGPRKRVASGLFGEYPDLASSNNRTFPYIETYSGYIYSCPPYSCGGSFGIAPNSSFRNAHTFHQHKTYLTTYILPQSIYKKSGFNINNKNLLLIRNIKTLRFVVPERITSLLKIDIPILCYSLFL